MTTERWLPIPGFDGLYEVSDLGRVRSNFRGRTRLLNPTSSTYGYPQVTLHLGKGAQTVRVVHRLVADLFIGPRPDGLIVRHLDGDKYNCAVSNLRYGTHAENAADSVRLGEHYNATKTHCNYGHELTSCRGKGKRGCRTCRAAYHRLLRASTPESRAARKAAGLPAIDLAGYFADLEGAA